MDVMRVTNNCLICMSSLHILGHQTTSGVKRMVGSKNKSKPAHKAPVERRVRLCFLQDPKPPMQPYGTSQVKRAKVKQGCHQCGLYPPTHTQYTLTCVLSRNSRVPVCLQQVSVWVSRKFVSQSVRGASRALLASCPLALSLEPLPRETQTSLLSLQIPCYKANSPHPKASPGPGATLSLSLGLSGLLVQPLTYAVAISGSPAHMRPLSVLCYKTFRDPVNCWNPGMLLRTSSYRARDSAHKGLEHWLCTWMTLVLSMEPMWLPKCRTSSNPRAFPLVPCLPPQERDSSGAKVLALYAVLPRTL